MSILFKRLLDDALSEVSRREPDYFSRFSLALPASNCRIERYLQQSLVQRYSPAQIDNALADGIAYFDALGVNFAETTSDPDPLAQLMLDSIMDAFIAVQDNLFLQPGFVHSRSFPTALADAYDSRQTPSGRRYLVGQRGRRQLLLINALGIPLTVWWKLLFDPSHDFQIIVVESRCGDFLAGGMQSDVDLSQHAIDISEVLSCESIDQIDVLAWCNAGRVAIELARKCAGQIRSLVLLSTTLRGIKGVDPRPSPFEDNFEQIFSTIAKNRALAGPLIKMLSRLSKPPVWDTLTEDPAARAAALFRLPARDHTATLQVPMSRPEFLINYGSRTTSDESYPLHEVLSKINVPLFLITGDHDNVVSNAFTCAALSTWANAVIHASISGAGHYVQDLQYPYFCWLLKSFLYEEAVPSSTARVIVQQIGQ